MKDQDKIESTFEAVQNLEKVEVPARIYENVMQKVQEKNELHKPMSIYLKWAAIAVLILVNMVSYVKFQNESINILDSTVDFQVSDLISEYGLNDYNDDTF